MVESDGSLPADMAGEIASLVLPGSGGIVAQMFAAVRREWDVNRSAALKAAERTAGLSREDLAERIEHHPELVPLVTRLLWEAAMTGQSQILEAMGAAFGAAVGDPKRTGDFEIILGGLRNLRGRDVRVLRELKARAVFHLQSDAEFQETAEVQSASALGGRLQESDDAVASALARLAGQGFAVSTAVYDGTRYGITDLGRLLCEALERMSNS